MIDLLLNGLEVVKRSQDGGVNDRPRRQPWMDAENEFSDRLIMRGIILVHSSSSFFQIC